MTSSARNRVLMAVGAVAVALIGSVIGYTVADDDDGGSTKIDASGTDSGSTDDTNTDDTDDTTDDTADDDEPSLAPLAAVPTDGLTGPALDLANAINLAAGITYHAVFEGEHANQQGGPSHVKVEVWRQAGEARRDTVISSPDGTLQTRELRLSDALTGCVDTQKGDSEPEWICVPSEGKGVDPAEPILGTARPTAGVVTVRDDFLGGVPARCYTVTDEAAAKVQEVCFDADSIPVSINGGDGRITRTTLGRGVDPDVIAVPEGAEMRDSAEPAGPAGPA